MQKPQETNADTGQLWESYDLISVDGQTELGGQYRWAYRTRTYDLNLFEEKNGCIETSFFFWLLPWFMCLKKFVRPSNSLRPLIPDLRTRRWFSD